MILAFRVSLALLAPTLAFSAPVFLENQFELPRGFRIYRAATAELSGGSYDLAFDGQGRLLVGDGNAVRRLKDADGDGVFDSFEVIATGLGVRGPQGLLVYGDRLYAVGGDGIQLYEGYGSASGLVHKGRIGQPFRTGGDHEAHTILRGHDGHLYFISGDGGGVLDRWHITESNSPVMFERAASVFRISRDGKRWECVGAGGRNPPNLGQNYLGELFSFDSDMEWHVGLPFWRPTRLNHWLTGGDHGWQEVGAYPPYYIDNLPGILDVGRGSPTWGVFYEHNQLPERYRDAFLVCDYRWKRESDDQYATSGRLVAFFLTREGAGWKAKMETLARPKPEARDAEGKPISFALVDVAVAPDGSLFLSDHNQGIWRISYGEKLEHFSKMPASKAATPVQSLLGLPQPAAEWSRLAEEALKKQIGKDWRQQLEAVALTPDAPHRDRLRAVRLLSEDYEALSNEFVSTLSQDADAELRGQAAWLLGIRGGAEARVRLPLRLRDPDPFVRRRAAEAATRVVNMPFAPLITAMGDSERLVRYAAMAALAHQPTDTWFSHAAAQPKLQVQMRALVAAKVRHELPSATNIYALTKRMLNARTLTREEHLDLLRVVGIFREQMQKSTTVRRFLLEKYPSGDRDVDFEHVRLFGEYQVTNAFPKLLQSLESEADYVRQFHIAQAIARLPAGWSEAEEQRLLNWFLKQQSGWFAEFKSKGVEFPQFWSAVLFEFARHHSAAVLGAKSKVELTSLLGGVYLDLLASTPGGTAALIALHDQPAQNGEVRSRIVRRLAQEKPATARHSEIVLASFRDATDRELLRACAGFLTKHPTNSEAVAERAIILLERERSLFKPLNDLLATLGQTKSAPGRGVERPEPAVREQNLAFWKRWFHEQFNRDLAKSPVEAAEQPDEEIHGLIFLNQLTGGNAARGGQIYERLQCHTCHGGGTNPGREGRLFGPDLAGVARRLNRQELADSLVFPSKQVPDRFKGYELTLKDSTVLTGFITEHNEKTVTFVERDQVRQIARSEIASLTPQKNSLMPDKLINRLTREELADLMAFLEK
jgi:putative heme-binding domain-containing protein